CICASHPWTDCVTAIGTAVGALGTVVTAGIAWYVAATWRDSLRHSTKHEIATKVLEEARLLRYMFYEVRSSPVLASEFPPSYQAKEKRDRGDEADGWVFVYTTRWKTLRP